MKKVIFLLAVIMMLVLSCKGRSNNNASASAGSFKKGKDAQIIGRWRTIYFLSGGQKIKFAKEATLVYIFKADNTFKLYTKGLEGSEHSAEGLYNCQKNTPLSKLDLFIKKVVDMSVPEEGKAYYMVYKIEGDLLYLGITKTAPIEITTMEDMRPLSVDNSIVLKKQ